MARYIENLNECTDPTSGDWLHIINTSAGGTDKDQKVDVVRFMDQGSWTPAITFGGNATGLTYSARSGRYVKNGKLVFVSAYIALSNKGSSTGAAKITGLPTAHAATISSVAPMIWYQMTTSFVYVTGLIDTSATTISLYGYTAAGVSYAGLTHADFANNSIIQMTATYEAS